ncbi:MAG TPA: hypothetical protein VF159_05430 [Gemmatimonadaceae bacterium]|nr:hypothetical protein [Vicinamibacterales bacterium]
MATPIVIALLATIWSGDQPDLALRLECRTPHEIRFELRNDGTVDTAVVAGVAIGDGPYFTVEGLELFARTPAGSQIVYRFRPYRYPVAVRGTAGQWLEPIPVHGTFRMTALSADFVGNGERPDVFPSGATLTLRWTIPAPRPERMKPFFWSGTLTSNTCAPKAAR